MKPFSGIIIYQIEFEKGEEALLSNFTSIQVDHWRGSKHTFVIWDIQTESVVLYNNYLKVISFLINNNLIHLLPPKLQPRGIEERIKNDAQIF